MSVNRNFSQFVAVIIASVMILSGTLFGAGLPRPPATARGSVVDTVHGVSIADPYRWLEDQWSDQTRAWIDEQNSYTEEVFKSLPNLESIEARLSELMKVDYVGTPSQRPGKFFLYKRGADQDLYTICMRRELDGVDEVLLDPHSLSEDHTISYTLFDISLDGALIAFGIRKGGEDQTEVHFMNTDTKEELTDTLPKAYYYGQVVLDPRNAGVFYCRYDSEDGPKVFYHTFGQDLKSDEMIFEGNASAEEFIGIDVSQDGKYLILSLETGSSGEKNELYFKELGTDQPVQTLVNDITANFSGIAVGNYVYLKTDWEAPNGRIFVVNLKDPASQNWREVVPVSDLVMKDFSLTGGKLCVTYLDSVKSKVSVFEPNGQYVRDISFPNIGSVSSVHGRWDSDLAFYSFTSYNSPRTVYRYSVATGESEIWEKSSIEIDPSSMEIKQVWFESTDSAVVPMFVVHKKGIKLDGTNPTLLSGYGGFRISQTPHFSKTILTWVENGGIYAVANIRGGSEFGEEWHKAATFENKQHSFDDFIAAAEWLIDNKYTRPSKLAIRGGSNGGLLVGAVMNQRPELFKAVICSYPLLDMVRFHNFLVAKFWVSEYGSSDDPDQFKYIYDYSPYHQVKADTEYPAVLFLTGDGDTRVDPCHARKMTALMQATVSSENPILLRYEIKAGHSGGKPKSKIIKDSAEELGFLFWQLDAAIK